MPRPMKYRAVTRLEWVDNRLTRCALHRRWAPRAFALLESVGKRSGRPRYTPVGNRLTGPDMVWLIAGHGWQSDHTRNIRRRPRVRVKMAGRWLIATATPLPDDDTSARSRALPYRWDPAIARAMASRPLIVRIDLDPAGA